MSYMAAHKYTCPGSGRVTLRRLLLFGLSAEWQDFEAGYSELDEDLQNVSPSLYRGRQQRPQEYSTGEAHRLVSRSLAKVSKRIHKS